VVAIVPLAALLSPATELPPAGEIGPDLFRAACSSRRARFALSERDTDHRNDNCGRHGDEVTLYYVHGDAYPFIQNDYLTKSAALFDRPQTRLRL